MSEAHLGLFYWPEPDFDCPNRRGKTIRIETYPLEQVMSNLMTGADMVIRALQDHGVTTLFGYPGGAVLPIYDALFHQDQINHILVRDEQGAAHAAEGFARSSG